MGVQDLEGAVTVWQPSKNYSSTAWNASVACIRWTSVSMTDTDVLIFSEGCFAQCGNYWSPELTESWKERKKWSRIVAGSSCPDETLDVFWLTTQRHIKSKKRKINVADCFNKVLLLLFFLGVIWLAGWNLDGSGLGSFDRTSILAPFT
jgi:hypothetical protein